MFPVNVSAIVRLSPWVCFACLAAAQDQPPLDLSSANLEDLMNLQVTTVSKRQQKLARTAAAVFVITAEDIRRSGATNLPDVLRMAPGVDVQQIDANAWAISIRGFNQRYSNKVLVMIDGRTVYTPTFSGVYWDQIDMPLDNIERIEVIRGPGSTIWGANAVNGVISILTKSAKATKGGLVQAGGGSEMAQGVVQYGGDIGASADFRVFGKGLSVGNSANADGSGAYDRWSRLHTGFRSDWDMTPNDSLTVEGDLFRNHEKQTEFQQLFPAPFLQLFGQPIDAAGGDVLARWDHRSDSGAETSLQAYYDSYRRDDISGPEVARTFDLDFQDHFTAGERNEIVWGLDYRVSDSGLSPGYWIGFNPPFRRDALYSGFLEDEIRIADSMWLTLGSKIEHNAYTGFEWEPGLRLVWNPPGTRHALWAAASKAIRQPSRVDAEISAAIPPLPIGNGVALGYLLQGNPSIKAETMYDYEAGYRREFSKDFSLDIATFLSFYRNVETVNAGTAEILPGLLTVVRQTFQYGNDAKAVDYGGEVSLNWKVSRGWRILPGYSYLHSTIRMNPGVNGDVTASVPVMFPENLLQLRSQISLARGLEFDQSLYYTARLPGSTIPADPRMDLRLSRRFGERTEASLVGQNLQRPRSMEYGNSWGILGTYVERSIYGQITWRF